MIHDIWKQNHAIVEGRVGWIDRHFKSATPSIQKENNKKKGAETDAEEYFSVSLWKETKP